MIYYKHINKHFLSLSSSDYLGNYILQALLQIAVSPPILWWVDRIEACRVRILKECESDFGKLILCSWWLSIALLFDAQWANGHLFTSFRFSLVVPSVASCRSVSLFQVTIFFQVHRLMLSTPVLTSSQLGGWVTTIICTHITLIS